MERLKELPAAIWILFGTALLFFLSQALTRRPPLPKGAPPPIKPGAGDWPVLGSLRFFSDRRSFMLNHITKSITGNFSFYFGKHHIVGLGGPDGKKTFFESKHLDMSEGYSVLFTGTPSLETEKNDESIGVWFTRTLSNMIKADGLSKNLSSLVGATSDLLQSKAPTPGEDAVMDPFDDIYRVVYALTMRTVGTAEIYRSPELMDKTLRWFEKLQGSSAVQIIFPWLPTFADLNRMYAGGRLYYLLKGFVDDRKKTGRREEDALQYLIDSGDDDIKKVISLVVGSLFAGQLNSGINAAYELCWLASTPEWYRRVQDEVDRVVNAHRRSPDQSPVEVLSALSLKEWEGSFPMIDMCQREMIRHQMTGTAFRKNISNVDVPIGKTGQVIPPGSFAVYHLDDLHWNPEYYAEPDKWDPGRFLPEHEGKGAPLPFVGWGTGRHPCGEFATRR
jgi:hypothetical protein